MLVQLCSENKRITQNQNDDININTRNRKTDPGFKKKHLPLTHASERSKENSLGSFDIWLSAEAVWVEVEGAAVLWADSSGDGVGCSWTFGEVLVEAEVEAGEVDVEEKGNADPDGEDADAAAFGEKRPRGTLAMTVGRRVEMTNAGT